MAVAIKSGFAGLKTNLEITGLQAPVVSARQQNLRVNLAAEMTVLDSFLIGSYQRNTMIAPLSEADVDIFMVMDGGYFKDGPASLLDKVKRALQKKYPSDISRNGQAVTIRFSDFQVDVVPGFNREGGGYLIPDSVLKQWISTDPKQHISLWSESNSRLNGQLVPVIKMLKAWNRNHSAKMHSFHLECLARQLFAVQAITEYAPAIKFFFEQARWNYSMVFDPAGYSGNVGAYLDTQTKRNEVETRLSAAFDKATDAITLEGQGKISAAFDKWRIVFGNYFPNYG